MTLTLEEEHLLEAIQSAKNKYSTKMGYYTLIYRIEKAGFSMPKRYKELFDTSPSILVLYNEETKMLEGVTEDETKVLEAPNFSEFSKLVKAEYPNHILERVDEIPDAEGLKGGGIFDSRFKVNGYRLDVIDHIGMVTLFLNFKKGEATGQKRVSQAFNLTERFFRVVHESSGYRRRKRKSPEQTEFFVHFDAYSISPASGYTKEGRAFVDLPIFKNALPVHKTRKMEEYETIRIYGKDLNEAYVHAAEHIVQNYESNGELKNV